MDACTGHTHQTHPPSISAPALKWTHPQTPSTNTLILKCKLGNAFMIFLQVLTKILLYKLHLCASLLCTQASVLKCRISTISECSESVTYCLLGGAAELEGLCEGGHDGGPALVGILLLEGVGLLVPFSKVGHGLVQRL